MASLSSISIDIEVKHARRTSRFWEPHDTIEGWLFQLSPNQTHTVQYADDNMETSVHRRVTRVIPGHGNR